MTGVGISLNAAIGIEGERQGGMLVKAVQDIVAGTELAVVPKDACITIMTTKISEILLKEGIGGGVGLVIAVWYERGIGAESRWAGYFDSLAKREYIPIFWTDKELQLLEGTEISGEAHNDREDVKEDFETLVVPLIQKYPKMFNAMAATTLDSFMEAASLVSSRAFAVDDHHGDGMVPLADVFNHKVSLVKLSSDYVVHGASDSDDLSEGEEAGNPETEAIFEIGLPNPLGASEHSICGAHSANGLPLKLHIAIIDDGSEDDALQIVAASDIAKDQEIFNTYGELGNSQLVKKYGFCLMQNPFTAVQLEKHGLLSEFKAQYLKGGAGREKNRYNDDIESIENFLRDIGDKTELLDEDEEPFLIYSQAHVNISLCVLLYLLIHVVQHGTDKSVEDLIGDDFVSKCASEEAPISVSVLVTESNLPSKLVESILERILGKAINSRLERYPMSMDDTNNELDKVDGKIGEHSAAVRAACTLRHSEMQLLLEMREEIQNF